MTDKIENRDITGEIKTTVFERPMQRDYYETELDVLRILKSHARLTELNSVYMGYPKTIVITIEPNDDNYEMVKRWIENEKL